MNDNKNLTLEEVIVKREFECLKNKVLLFEKGITFENTRVVPLGAAMINMMQTILAVGKIFTIQHHGYLSIGKYWDIMIEKYGPCLEVSDWTTVFQTHSGGLAIVGKRISGVRLVLGKIEVEKK